ncbi:piRNA biogenesis protein EXD1 [Erpetoichthys calabaricus]|uniref:3'-5' exonuclease domain-containing protein n=1 Tax=Erpetoichthys calabaricus TaxID=27687 RepID=A0A8C4XHR2_ERPCA|nr:piRNA biogenesis protein EXD1 [Erpetoichthys calabaricus]
MEELETFLTSFQNERIYVALKTGSKYVGTVRQIHMDKTLLLEKVVDVQTGREFQGLKLFLGHEIKNVGSAENIGAEGEPSTTYSHHDDVLDEGSEDIDLEDHCGMKAQLNEFHIPGIKNAVEDENIKYIVIDSFCDLFVPAIMHIKKQKVIGVGISGVGLFQQNRLCWMQIATKTRVYLFDIMLLGSRAFKNGLTIILEDSNILKVIHDCRSMSSCLHTLFRTDLTSVFDTQVADVMYYYNETGGYLPDRVSPLEECLVRHLKISASSLQFISKSPEIFYDRPCPAHLLSAMALSVVHLQELRLALLDALMSDFTSLVDTYLSINLEEPVHFQALSPDSILDLPKELRQLEVKAKQRREWAQKEYQMNEVGLLIRPSLPLGEEIVNKRPESRPYHQNLKYTNGSETLRNSKAKCIPWSKACLQPTFGATCSETTDAEVQDE